MKRTLRPDYQRSKDYSGVLTGIETGVSHLHGLGLVHDDINPGNTMMNDGKVAIIDFSSCGRVGESLESAGHTYERDDEQVETALPQNDLDALEKIQTWLADDSRPFQFDE